MTDHETATDAATEGAEPRPAALTDKIDEIMNSPVEGREPGQSSPTLNPDNPHEARDGAITEHDNKGNDPGATMGGGS